MFRLLDEALPMGNKGVLLFAEREDTRLTEGCRLRDARGQEHTVSRIDRQEDLITLLIEGGEAAYFERLFRDVRVDATAFDIVE